MSRCPLVPGVAVPAKGDTPRQRTRVGRDSAWRPLDELDEPARTAGAGAAFAGGSGDKGMVFNTDLTQALELGFLLELAECMVVPGLARKESRGATRGRTTTLSATTRTSCGTRS